MIITTENAAAALAALYNSSHAFSMGLPRKDISVEDAQETLNSGSLKDGIYFDYLGGRVMKLNFKAGQALDFRLYDRDNGQGAGEGAVAEVAP